MGVSVKVGSSWLHGASYVTFSIWSIKCSKTRPGSEESVKWSLAFVSSWLEHKKGAHEIYYQKQRVQNVNSFAFPVLSLRLRTEMIKPNDQLGKITFSPALVVVTMNKLQERTEILLTRWSCYSLAPGFPVQSFYCMSPEKKCNQQWKPFSLPPPTNPKRKQKR